MAQRKYKDDYCKAVKQIIDFAFNTVNKETKDRFLQIEEIYNAVVYYSHKYIMYKTEDKPDLNY